MRHVSAIAMLFICTVFLTACPGDKFKDAPEILPGYTLIPAPNTLDKPGTIFGIDAKGIKQPLDILDLDMQSGTTAVGGEKGTKKSSVGVLLSFLGAKNINATGDANADVNKELTYGIQLSESSMDQIALLKVSEQLEKTKDIIKKFSAINNMADYKFYIITQAVKAKKLTYAFDTKKAGEIGLKADIDKVITVNPKVNWDNASQFLLSYDLNEPLYVFAKYFELNVESQVTGDTKFTLGKEVKSTDPLYN